MIQTRSEETGLGQHKTLKEAFEAAKNDPTIWKISFCTETGERVRLVRIHEPNAIYWVYEYIGVASQDDR